jgi:hypothetical protein
MKKVFWIFVLALCVCGTKRYVSTTGDNAHTGVIGSPWRTVTYGCATMNAGDTLYLRGGTYIEHSINLGGRIGTASSKFYVASYPGEWAKIDGNHQGNYQIFWCGANGANWTNSPAYWKFENFEVCGAGPSGSGSFDDASTGKGFGFWSARHMEFYRLYVHDNYGGHGNNGGAGISVANKDDHGAQYITIKYCYLKNNGWPGSSDENLTNIVLYGDYNDIPGDIPNLTYPLQGNEIAYNLIEGAPINVKTKSCQRLVLDNSGTLSTSMNGKALGDKIHHNILKGGSFVNMTYEQDFEQVYNNIFDQRGFPNTGCETTSPASSRQNRESFYTCLYNNTYISDGSWSSSKFAVKQDHGQDFTDASNYNQFTDKYHPFIYMYNNLFYSTTADKDFNIHLDCFPTSSVKPKITDINWNTIHIQSNFFADRAAADKAFSVGYLGTPAIDAGGDGSAGYVFSINGFATLNTSNVNSARAVGYTSLFSDTAKKLLNPSCIVSGSSTIANSGKGGSHPYLEGVTIPSYIGAALSTDTWVATVLSLKNLPTLDTFPSDTLPPAYGNHIFIKTRRDSVVSVTGKGFGAATGTIHFNALTMTTTGWNDTVITLTIPTWMPRGYYTRKIYKSTAALIDSFYHGVRVVVPSITGE